MRVRDGTAVVVAVAVAIGAVAVGVGNPIWRQVVSGVPDSSKPRTLVPPYGAQYAMLDA